MLTLYGLKSCDTCRKARQAAEKAGEPLTFVDIRESPLTDAERERFHAAFGEKLVNKASTTWRNLSEAERAEDPLTLIERHPALMKRPVIEGKELTLGWNAEVQKAHLG